MNRLLTGMAGLRTTPDEGKNGSTQAMPVIPAQAGIQGSHAHPSSQRERHWIPACAGMTDVLNRRYILTVAVLLLGAALLFSVPGRAETALPSYYPDSFMALGEVQGVNSTDHLLVIDALRYRYTAAIRVHTLAKENDFISKLRSGMKVGFNFSGSGATRTLDEVWEIPSTVELPRL